MNQHPIDRRQLYRVLRHLARNPGDTSVPYLPPLSDRGVRRYLRYCAENNYVDLHLNAGEIVSVHLTNTGAQILGELRDEFLD